MVAADLFVTVIGVAAVIGAGFSVLAISEPSGPPALAVNILFLLLCAIYSAIRDLATAKEPAPPAGPKPSPQPQPDVAVCNRCGQPGIRTVDGAGHPAVICPNCSKSPGTSAGPRLR